MAKHKYIETPEKLWELFEKYREHTKKNPILKQDYVGKDGTCVYRELERPLTHEGFREYCFDNGISVAHYITNLDGRYSEYVSISTRIKEAIRNEQIAGGMAGIYNASLTARLNGLTEKIEQDTKLSGKVEITLDLGNNIPNG